MRKRSLISLLSILFLFFLITPLMAASWPGPDGYGYRGSSASYQWIEISSTGTQIMGLGDDNYVGPFDIGFSFNFYGSNFTQFYVGSNGFISFGGGSSSLSNQCPLPNDISPNNIISLMWDDIDFRCGATAYYQSFANCPVGSGQCLVVEFLNTQHYSCNQGGASAGTWETILYANGDILMQFQDTGAEMGSGSTTGIEGNNAARDHGLTYNCDTAGSLSDNTALLFSRQRQQQVESVPTMTEWGMIIFIVLAGLASVYYLRRQRRA